MILKAYDKKFNEYSDIDKFILVPKKVWDDIAVGEQEISINQKKVKLRVYDVPCDCAGVAMHSHRIIDLRNIWDKLGLKDSQELEITK